jgi:hypothetical protein
MIKIMKITNKKIIFNYSVELILHDIEPIDTKVYPIANILLFDEYRNIPEDFKIPYMYTELNIIKSMGNKFSGSYFEDEYKYLIKQIRF